MSETIKQSKLRTQNLRTQYCFGGKILEMEFGKPVKLPNIRKNRLIDNIYSHNSNTSHRFTESDDNSQRKQHSSIHKIDELTLQELQLCKSSNKEHKKKFPLITTPQQSNQYQKPEKKISKTLIRQNVVQGYKMSTILGRGCSSIVRIAQDKQGQKCAIKSYPLSKLQKYKQKQQNLRRQIAILSQVIHPNILCYRETLKTEQAVHIITEIVEGVSLSEQLQSQSNKFSEDKVKEIMKQIFSAFAYLHNRNIIHRDLKLSNIIINNKKSQIKVIDFGFSVQLQDQLQLLYQFCGTPHYIAPQIVNKQGYLGKPADVWSLGILMYRMLMGNFPFKGMNQKTIFVKIKKGVFKQISGISNILNKIIIKMLSIDPNKRPSVQQLQQQKWFNS